MAIKITPINCPDCGSAETVKYGRTPTTDKQRYRCQACQRHFVENPDSVAYSEAERDLILRAYQERPSLRGISRTFGISRNTVASWLKKKEPTTQALEASLLPAQAGDVLECDELWSLKGSKRHQRWIWLALCRRTRQIVAYAIGRRDDATCRVLWSRVPSAYRAVVHCVTDCWESYYNVLPPQQHRGVGKTGRGETNHVERFNNTLRQRLARLVRKTLSFSKSDQLHEIVLKLFLLRYNLERKQAINSN